MKKLKVKDLSVSPEYYASFSAKFRELLLQDDSFKARYCAQEFESKLLVESSADGAVVRRERAIEKWLSCEVFNRDSSVRLMHHSHEDELTLSSNCRFSAAAVIATARRFISETIGEHVPWEELICSFSGGASTSIKRGPGAIARKYQKGIDITEGAVKHFQRLNSSVVWLPGEFNLVEGNVMFTVPKSSTIDRCACKEPDLNMYVQKAIGDQLRRCLRRAGINLNDQSINNRLARVGSIDGSLATIDLSSASDSVTTQLVLLLLPDEWFYLMDDVRSPITLIDGVPHENVMFSSMGNGFTFELESLIFWALARSCAYHSKVRGTISVYGDDLVCPEGLYDFFVETLEFCGFKPNSKKSFNSGGFRESCGKHWLSGLDVTPFYVKGVPTDVSDWCLLLNHLREWAISIPGICDPRYYALWDEFSQLVPTPIRGGKDLASRENLVAPGRMPIAKCLRKKIKHNAVRDAYALGAYLQWLDVTKDRPAVTVSSIFPHAFEKHWGEIEHRHAPLLCDDLETSLIEEDGKVVLRRARFVYTSDCPSFPQELGQG